MLHVILLDCAIELVPLEIRSVKQIQQYASRRKKRPDTILLDQTHHGQAMLRLTGHERRGRPDIVYLSLMTLLESPLCKSGLLTIHLHLQDGRIIEVKPEVRLPRNYDRFVGLIEQLLITGKVPPKGNPLLHILDISLDELLQKLVDGHEHALRLLAAEDGIPCTPTDLESLLPADASVPVILGVGAFPHGDITPSVVSLFTKAICLDSEVMMAWHVCAEALWTYTNRIDVINKRFSSSGLR